MMVYQTEIAGAPGWRPLFYEDEATRKWCVYHRCVDCGYMAGPYGLMTDWRGLLEHTAKKHPVGAFALELFLFRRAVCHMHDYDVFEWPDENLAAERNEP